MTRLAKAGIALATVTALSAAALFLARIPIAELAIGHWLSGQGLPERTIVVKRLDATGITISATGNGTGPNRDSRAGNLEIRWTVGGLLRGRVESVTAEQIYIPVDWHSDGVSVAGVELSPSARDTTTSTRFAADLPVEAVHLRDVTFHLYGAYGEADLSIPVADLDRAPDGQLVLSGSAGISSRQGSLRASFTGSGAPEGILELRVADIDGTFASDLVSLSGLSGDATAQFENLRLARAETTLSAGRIEHDLAAWPPPGPATLHATYAKEGAEVRFETARADSSEHAMIEVSSGPIKVEDGTASTIANITARADTVAAAGVNLSDVSISLPLRLTHRPDRVAASFVTPGTIAIARLDASGFASIPAPASFRLEDRTAAALTIDLDDWELALGLTVESEGFRLQLPSSRSRKTSFNTGPLRADISGDSPGLRLSARISLDAPAAQGPDLSAGSAVIDLKLSGIARTIDATARISGLQDRGDPAILAPVDVTLHATGPLTSISIQGNAATTSGMPLATIRGRLPPRDDAPLAELDIGPYVFSPGALQPVDLMPSLARLDEVEGTVRANALVPGLGPSRGTLVFDKLSFSLAGQRVEGLDSRLEFQDLSGPVTERDQTLSIQRIDLPVPARDVMMRFALAPTRDGASAIDVASLRLDMLGGTVEAGPQVLRLGRENQELSLRVHDMDLDQVFDLADVDGVSGAGKISGGIPVALEGGDLAIHDAELSSESGVLRIRADKAADFLSGQGQSVDAALRALEDFRYSELTIGADKAAGGDARLRISVLGHNPAVLDGHPFRFNINLTSNIDELVAAIMRGYRIANDAVGRTGSEP